MKKILLSLLAVALFAMPAYASVQNIKVSGDVESSYLYRTNFDFGLNSDNSDEAQSLFITQTRLRVDADLTDNVAATVALINERVWNGTATTSSTDIDLNLAYVTLREMLYSPLTVVIGRQDFRYGNSLIIDSAGPNNAAPGDSGLNNVAEDMSKQSAFDAVRAILDYNPLTVELAFVELNPGHTTLATTEDDAKLYGINASYEFGDDMDSMMEAYIWKKVDKSSQDTLGDKADTILVKGLRGAISPTERLSLQLEWAMQTGNKDLGSGIARKRRAHIVQALASFQLPILEEYAPVAMYGFTKATGDNSMNNDDSGYYTAWDPLYENQAGGKIYNTLFSMSNFIIHELSLSAVPIEDVTAKVSLASLWLERQYDEDNHVALNQPDSSTANVTGYIDSKADASHLGKEFDIDLTYDYTEDVQLGASVGWFFPGSVFRLSDSENRNAAKQFLMNCLVKF